MRFLPAFDAGFRQVITIIVSANGTTVRALIYDFFRPLGALAPSAATRDILMTAADVTIINKRGDGDNAK